MNNYMKNVIMKYIYIVLLLVFSVILYGENDVIVIDLVPETTVEKPSKNTPKAKTTKKSDKAVKENKHKSGEDIKLGTYAMVIADIAYIYKQPKQGSNVLGLVSYQDVVIVKEKNNNFYGILLEDGKSIGWLLSGQLKHYDVEVWAKQNPDLPDKGIRGYAKERVPQSNIILQSFNYLRTPYVFGGTSVTRGMDCSAFVRDIFKKVYGISLPRTARQQATVGIDVPKNQASMKIGDRLYFRYKNSYIDHTGIYVGNGYYIHCNSSKHGVSIDYLWDKRPSSKLVSVKRFSWT